eukprot:365625-Chlamydomonas_euryale.AAC.2
MEQPACCQWEHGTASLLPVGAATGQLYRAIGAEGFDQTLNQGKEDLHQGLFISALGHQGKETLHSPGGRSSSLAGYFTVTRARTLHASCCCACDYPAPSRALFLRQYKGSRMPGCQASA